MPNNINGLLDLVTVVLCRPPQLQGLPLSTETTKMHTIWCDREHPAYMPCTFPGPNMANHKHLNSTRG